MKFSLCLPVDQVDPASEFCTAEAIAEMSQAAEAAGFDAVHATEHPFPTETGPDMGGHFAFDLVVTLTIAAVATKSIRLHTNGLVIPYRNPFVSAKALGDLDVASGGRVIAGVVAGYMATEFEALGVSLDDRNELMDEGIRAMRAAWTGEPVTMSGKHWNATGNRMKPLPSSPPPIWVGGNSKSAIRRAAALADGWMPFPAKPKQGDAVRTASMMSLDDLRERIALFREEREKAGRTEPYDICMTPFTHQHHPRGRENYDPAVLLDELGHLSELGVTWVSVKARSPNRQVFLENIQRWSEEVLAKADR